MCNLLHYMSVNMNELKRIKIEQENFPQINMINKY